MPQPYHISQYVLCVLQVLLDYSFGSMFPSINKTGNALLQASTCTHMHQHCGLCDALLLHMKGAQLDV